MTPDVRRRVKKWVTQAGIGLVGYGVVIFLPAGSLGWVWGWAQLGVLAALMAAHPLILIPINPGLLAERQKGMWDTGVKAWDKILTTMMGALMVLSWVIAGFDYRFGWTGPLPLACHLGGLVLEVLGFSLFMWAMASNAFFAEGVRIQEDRGHTVATGGPYHYVRHPGYAGTILAQLGTPFLLGSPWAMIPSAGLALVFALRTLLEDRTLMEELSGYAEFARRTRYRLLPGVW
jgi:protein-S-isoprenylcysteine O-methyltransferase Ste14